MPASPTRQSRSISTRPRPVDGRQRLAAAIAAGKHVYTEKPVAETLEQALSLARQAQRAGVKNGVVQDKLFLPGLKKLRRLYDADYFGRVLSIRLDFGWWVFNGELYPSQRPSWNYRARDRRRADPRYVRALALHFRPAARADRSSVVPRDNGATATYRRGRQTIRCRCRGPRLRDLRIGRRGDRANQLVLGEPGQTRRPLTDPGRRRQGLGGVRPPSLLRPAVGRDAAAVFRPRAAAKRGVRRRMAGDAETSTRSRTAIARAGNCFCAMSSRTCRSRRR